MYEFYGKDSYENKKGNEEKYRLSNILYKKGNLTNSQLKLINLQNNQDLYLICE